MLVKERYSHFSDGFLYELLLSNRFGYKHYYQWWMDLKERTLKSITLEESLKLSKIHQAHMKMLKR